VDLGLLPFSYFKPILVKFKQGDVIVAEKFIRSLVEKYGKHTVYTDGGTWLMKHVIY
jgi:hypothetical protein